MPVRREPIQMNVGVLTLPVETKGGDAALDITERGVHKGAQSRGRCRQQRSHDDSKAHARTGKMMAKRKETA
jgi:hypothetical protein